MLEKLNSELHRQIRDRNVEVVHVSDDRQMSIGQKTRRRLLSTFAMIVAALGMMRNVIAPLKMASGVQARRLMERLGSTFPACILPGHLWGT